MTNEELMTADLPTERLRHPAWMVVGFGGAIGAALNLALTFGLLRAGIISSLLLACFVGTLANQVFHFAYYEWVLLPVHQRVRSPLLRAAEYVLIALFGVGLLWIAVEWLHIRELPATLLVLGVLSALNLLLVRMASLASPELATIEYTAMDESFYEDQTDASKVNPIRAWFHRSRFDRLKRFVHEYYRDGMRLADLGCGNCMWNEAALPVTGVDVNRPMMEWAHKHNRLVDYRVTPDLSKTGLADCSIDIVIMSETLEHLVNLDNVLREVRRIIKDDGVFLITVPHDYFFSPFFFLFNINCLYQGFARGSAYHRVRCGHVNHFTKTRLRRKLQENGWAVRRIDVVNSLSLYVAAQKVFDQPRQILSMSR